MFKSIKSKVAAFSLLTAGVVVQALAALGTEEQAAVDAAEAAITDYGTATIIVMLGIAVIAWTRRVIR